jgi:hypothetical protein
MIACANGTALGAPPRKKRTRPRNDIGLPYSARKKYRQANRGPECRTQ